MRILFLANTDWYLYNFRQDLAHALRVAGHEVVMAAPRGEFAKRLEADGYEFRAVEISRQGLNPVSEFAAVRRLEALYREVQPDVVHHFTLKAVVLGSLAARRAGIEHVINAIAGLGYAFSGDGLKARTIRRGLLPVLRRALAGSDVIFQNPDDQATLRASGVLEDVPTHLIKGSGVDISAFAMTPEPEGDPVVMLPGRMLWSKGVGTFAGAAERVRFHLPLARFVLVGSLDEEHPDAVTREDMERITGSGHVEWWGFQEAMNATLQQAHVVCLPSRYGEGVPRVLIEAAAIGRPLVGTDIPGCREIVIDHKTGLLVRPRDATALSEALLELLRDRDLRRKMAANARALAVRRFSTTTVIEETFEVYRKTAPGFLTSVSAPPEAVS